MTRSCTLFGRASSPAGTFAMDRSREIPDRRIRAYLLGEAAGLDQALGLIDAVLDGVDILAPGNVL